MINNGGGGVFVNDNGPGEPGRAECRVRTRPLPRPMTRQQQHDLGQLRIVRDRRTPPTTTGGSITGGTIDGNTITGHIGVFKATGPDLGGIVVAAASAGATVSDTQVTGNNISDSFEGGIIVHAHAPNDVVTGTVHHGQHGWAGRTTGDRPTARPPRRGSSSAWTSCLRRSPRTITDTTVGGNTIFGQFYGLWISGVTDVTDQPRPTPSRCCREARPPTTRRLPAAGTGRWRLTVASSTTATPASSAPPAA